MRVVYQAENVIDAHLVKNLLENAGIPAWVRGEFLTGGIGELPAQGLVAVMVPDSAQTQATAEIAAWMAGRDALVAADDVSPDVSNPSAVAAEGALPLPS